MNIEKTLISAIIALGIAASAALAAGGKLESGHEGTTAPAAPAHYADETIGDGLIAAHAFDSHEFFLGN